MEKYIQVFTTVNSEEIAKKIAQITLERKLVGCVQIIGPISSSYSRLF